MGALQLKIKLKLREAKLHHSKNLATFGKMDTIFAIVFKQRALVCN